MGRAHQYVGVGTQRREPLRLLVHERVEGGLHRGAQRGGVPSHRRSLLRLLDAARGRRIHEAFLKNPDAGVVSTILWRSPHRLDAELVKPLIDDERATQAGAKVCDYAAARLEAIDTGLAPELPAEEALRERRLKKWRSRR